MKRLPTDSLHGRRIVRALWDYYKINGIIESKYCQPKKGGDQEGRFDGWFFQCKHFFNKGCSRIPKFFWHNVGPGEASFSMLKLRKLSQQRSLYDSIESLTSSDDDSFWMVSFHQNYVLLRKLSSSQSQFNSKVHIIFEGIGWWGWFLGKT